jgi:hypothetical protein
VKKIGFVGFLSELAYKRVKKWQKNAAFIVFQSVSTRPKTVFEWCGFRWLSADLYGAIDQMSRSNS